MARANRARWSAPSPRLLAGAAAVVLLAGCGYRFAVGGSGLPSGTGAIHVAVFENRSSDPEAGALFARALGDSLAARGRLGGIGAPSRIEGVVVGVRTNPHLPHPTRPHELSPALYRVEAAVRLTLVVNGEVTCSREFFATDTYLPAVELTGLDANRGEALRRLAGEMMGGAEDRLCD